MKKLPDIDFDENLLRRYEETALIEDWRASLIIKKETRGKVKPVGRVVAYMSEYWKKYHSEDMSFQTLVFTLLYMYFTGQIKTNGHTEYDDSDFDDYDESEDLSGSIGNIMG